MRKLLLIAALGALSGAANAATVYMPSTGPVGVRISSATNATPIVLTTSDSHGLSDGNLINVMNVLGNTNANGLRYVDVLSATTLALYSDAGLTTPISGNGSWLVGGLPGVGVSANVKWLHKVSSFTTVSHPIAQFDGPTGTVTRNVRCAVDNSCLTSISVNSNVGVATVPSGYTTDITTGTSQIGVWNSTVTALNAAYTITAKTDTTLTFATSGVSNGVYTNPTLTVSKYAYTGNPPWDAIVTRSASNATVYHKYNWDPLFRSWVNSSVHWWVTRDATSLAVSTTAISRAEEAINKTAACNESFNYCYFRADAVDYSRGAVINLSLMYTLLQTSPTVVGSTLRDEFKNKIFNDIEDSCVNPYSLITVGTGTVSVVGSAVTGTGTQFQTLYSPGDILFFPDYMSTLNSDYFGVIQSIEDQTHLTLSLSYAAGSYSGAFSHLRKWQTGDCGVVWMMKHHPSAVVADPTTHPERGGTEAEGGGTSFYHNLVLTALNAYLHIGTVLADDDNRAIRLVQDMMTWAYDHTVAYNVSAWTGFTQAGGTYHWYRSPYYEAENVFLLKNSFNNYLNLIGTYRLGATLALDAYSQIPFATQARDNVYFILFGENSLNVDWYRFLLHAKILKAVPGTSEARIFNSFARNRFGGGALFNASNIGSSNAFAAVDAFLGFNPNELQTDNTTLPMQRIFNRNDFSTCEGLGMKYCQESEANYGVVISRTGWGNDTRDSMVQIFGGDYQQDHMTVQPADYRIIKSSAGPQPCLVGGDGNSCASINYVSNNIMDPGTSFIYNAGGISNPVARAKFTRWSGDPVTGDSLNRYAGAMVDYSQAFQTSANITRANRSYVHFKKSGTDEVLVVYDDFKAGTATRIKAYTHYAQNKQSGEGSTYCVSGTCSSVDIGSGTIVSTSTLATVVTKYFPVNSSTRFRTYVDNADGSYSGGAGYTFRVSYCATSDDTTCSTTATAMEALVVHRIVDGTSDRTITAEPLVAGSSWAVVQVNSKVAAFARNGSTNTVLNVTTTHSGTGQYHVSGLAPGTYDVTRNGSNVLVSSTVAGSDNSLYFETTSGDIVVTQTGSPTPPSITTTSLPDGTQGSSYSQSLSATSGAPAYTWSIESGSLPSGLSLSSGGLISGTPSGMGTSSFTVLVTDSNLLTDSQALSITVASSGGGGGSGASTKTTISGQVTIRGQVNIR